MDCRWLIPFACLVLGGPLLAENALQERHQELSARFMVDMEALASKCDELGLTEQARITRDWIAPRSSGRIVLYVPTPAGTLAAPDTAPSLVKSWHTKFSKLRQEFADGLFGLSAEAANEQDGELALRLCFEANHEDPEHKLARKILGLERAVTRKIAPKAGSTEHKQFGWRRNQHWVLESDHFAIESNESPKACLELARELEQLHDVWLQLYYPVWGSPDRIARRYSGENVDLLERKKFRVVLFKDRQEYERQLTKGTRNVGISSGVYYDEQQTSILVGGPAAKRSTWYHEVGHQLFQEYLEAKPGIAKESNMYLVESAAIFLESLVVHNGAAMLGGFDTENLQFARFRARGRDFQMPLAQLASLGREALQEHRDVRKIYGQFGGLAHFFMEGRDGQLREPFLKSLVAVYEGRAAADALATASQTSFAALDAEYLEFLDVTDAMIARTPPMPSITGLSLRRTAVTDAGLAAFAPCAQLQWLDLSLTQTGDPGLASFPESNNLKVLFLEKTRITDVSLEHVTSFSNLEELYLSGTNVSDAGLAHLPQLKGLTVLDLAGCKEITDAAVPTLLQLKSLESLDVAGTSISLTAAAKLRALPKLKDRSEK